MDQIIKREPSWIYLLVVRLSSSSRRAIVKYLIVRQVPVINYNQEVFRPCLAVIKLSLFIAQPTKELKAFPVLF